MTDETENLILEHLKRFQGGQERIERELKEVKGRLSQVEIGMAAVRGDVAHLSGDVAGLRLAFDTMSERIDRIERRLELV
jgi:tetrahydromethanopterin S-methyltransferase subunit G